MNKKEANKITGGLSAQAKCQRAAITCRPLHVDRREAARDSRAHRAMAAMPSKADTIFQMLKTPWPGAGLVNTSAMGSGNGCAN